MKHLLFLNIHEPSVERPSPSNIGLQQEDIIVIKNNIEQKKLPSVEIVAKVLHMYCFFIDSTSLTLLKKILLLFVKLLLINDSQGFTVNRPASNSSSYSCHKDSDNH